MKQEAIKLLDQFLIFSFTCFACWLNWEVLLYKKYAMPGTQREIIAIVHFYVSPTTRVMIPKESFLVVCGIALKLFLYTKYLVSDFFLGH